jgi:formylmethanofuran dehydrogenase subunit C
MTLVLALKETPPVPLEAERISPDVLQGLSREDVLNLEAQLGNRRVRLREFFEVDGEGSEEIVLRGDLSRVKYVGRGMTRGRIVIQGNAGMHLGAEMRGGEILVEGNASDWVGAEMRGGLIRIQGNAGNQVGAAYRGSPRGMRGGTIVVQGSCRNEVGMRMRRGLIYVGGRCGDFAGLQMLGGTLVLAGGAGIRAGGWMRGGTIVSFQEIRLLPTFLYACTYRPTFLRLIERHLEALGCPLPQGVGDAPFALYTGDTSVPGKGEIFVRAVEWKT